MRYVNQLYYTYQQHNCVAPPCGGSRNTEEFQMLVNIFRLTFAMENLFSHPVSKVHWLYWKLPLGMSQIGCFLNDLS